jgi:hypothetical protein
MKKRTILLFAILTLFISYNISVFNYTNAILPTGSAAIDFTLKDLNSGSMRTFSDYEGRVVVLGFFTSYGDFDAVMIQTFKDIRDAYPSSKVVLMMIAMDPDFDDEAIVLSIIDTYEITWMVFRDDGTISPYYEITESPGIYLITKNQNTYYGKNGPVAVDFTFISPKIDEILPDDPPTNPDGSIPEFWQKNWIWIMLGGIGVIVLSGLLIYRRRIVVHNRKVREQKMKQKQQKARKRNR